MDKLKRAGRDFLLRLIAQHGLAGAARVLRALADEIERLAREKRGSFPKQTTCGRAPAKASEIHHLHHVSLLSLLWRLGCLSSDAPRWTANRLQQSDGRVRHTDPECFAR